MTTQELISWCIAAQDIHEASWNPTKEDGCYTKTYMQSLEACAKTGTSTVELSIAHALMSAHWYDIQDWHKEFQKA